MKTYITIASVALLILVIAAKVIFAFQGPTQPPGTGSGAISVDASGNVGIGGTPTAGEKLKVGGGRLTVTDEIIGRRFIDEQNNAYYVDPAANLNPKVSANFLSHIVTAGGLIAGKIMGEGRANLILANSAGECVISGIKISRALPPVIWEGAAAACPSGWWVCTVAERGAGKCPVTAVAGDGNGASISFCRPGFYDQIDSISSTSRGRYYSGYVRSAPYNGGIAGGNRYAWVANANSSPLGVDRGLVSVDGGAPTFPDNVPEAQRCTSYPVWCCTEQ